ncbi:hypothetical protein ENINCK372B1_21215 [Enterobacter intestinihominis]
MHSFIDELISPEKFAQHIKDNHEVSIQNPTFITKLEDGVNRDEVNGLAIKVDSTTSKSYATINGIKYKINSLEDLEKLSQ